ncbi:hypothetical protein JCM8547_004232 [Rhodosporidiobolus lusitaniae]
MKDLARSLSCRSESSDPAHLLYTCETQSTAPTELQPQALPFDVLHAVFLSALDSADSVKERQQLCLNIALLSSDWTPFALRQLYNSQLTFRMKRFSSKKKRFSRFYRSVTRQGRLASAVTWLKVDLKLAKERLTALLASCEALQYLGLLDGETHISHLHAASGIKTLYLDNVELNVASSSFFRPADPLVALPLCFPRLSQLIISTTWFTTPAIGKLLTPTVLPSLKNLTTAGVFSWSEPALRDALLTLSPVLTSLTVLDPLRWTRHALLRCAPSLVHLRISELPKNGSSLRHLLPFLNASPFPLQTLTIHAQKIARRPSTPDTLAVLARGLILGLTERRTSLEGLQKLTLSGPGWTTEQIKESVDLLKSVCGMREVEAAVEKEEEDVREEWVERAMERV